MRTKKPNPRRQPMPEPKRTNIIPMGPVQVGRALKEVERLYEEGNPNIFTYEWKVAQIARIGECSKLWGEQ